MYVHKFSYALKLKHPCLVHKQQIMEKMHRFKLYCILLYNFKYFRSLLLNAVHISRICNYLVKRITEKIIYIYVFSFSAFIIVCIFPTTKYFRS